ncbi:MAG TPA: DUF4166 domain-containing protein [Candidatus Acidoferrum sp.]|nr:DUF4166 domain-containing protein [Candidatus Acidoferrum sp.]
MTNVFQLILRENYQQLPEVVRRFHETRLGQFSGKATVKGSTGLLARALRKLAGFPPPSANEMAVTVRVIRSEVQERWLRQFGDAQFSSALQRVNRQNLLCENFGMFSFYFSLSVRGDGIHWQFERWDFAGIPMPELLSPEVEARESVDADGRYAFTTLVEFPLIGVLMDYAGWLE